MNYNLDKALEPLYTSYPEALDRPLIGITTNFDEEDYSIRRYYCEQVERAGGVPMLLTPLTDVTMLAQQLDTLDAVIFSGGGDINPLWGGQEPIPELHNINPRRDSHELVLCQLAYNRHLPMLGICRGIQTLATALGGHVCQDIYSAAKNGTLKGNTARNPMLLKHSQDAPRYEETHSVQLLPGSIISSIYAKHNSATSISNNQLSSSLSNNHSAANISPLGGLGGAPSGASIFVNSFHHQAVDDPGERFRVTATAPDGIIEAIESTEHRSIMGVQWHPEHLADDGLPVFRWIVREARTFKQAKQLHHTMLTIDSHCDTPMFFPQNINFLQRDSRILYDLHKMDDGRIDAVQMVCYLPQPKIGEKFSDKIGFDVNGPASYADLIFDKIEAICAEVPHRLSIARTPADLYRDKREGRHSIVLGIENALALEHDIRNIQHFRQRGVTYITLCHNGDNDVCDSARGCNTYGGLSKFGRDVIREMNRQGIMVDLSHAAEASFYQALELSETPIVCSHSNCRALCDHPRNLTDDQMLQLAQHGGVMQLTLYGGFLSTAATPSIDDFLRHLEHAISIMGIDHVGIGTDFDGDGGVSGLADASELINITEHLLRRRYSESDIAKIWGKNWLRVMAQVQNR